MPDRMDHGFCPRSARPLRILCSLGVAWLLIAEVPARAATYNVDRNDDVVASGCSDAVANDCSLRGAIVAANGTVGADTINLPAGTYVLARSGRCEDAADTG